MLVFSTKPANNTEIYTKNLTRYSQIFSVSVLQSFRSSCSTALPKWEEISRKRNEKMLMDALTNQTTIEGVIVEHEGEGEYYAEDILRL
jgi:hypothetical protein